MQVHQYTEGLWRWSVGSRTCAYIEHGDVMIVVDPVLPPEGDDLARFRRAIARDVDRLGGPVHVVMTRNGHPRDCDALVAMTSGIVWHPGMGQAPAGLLSLPVAGSARRINGRRWHGHESHCDHRDWRRRFGQYLGDTRR